MLKKMILAAVTASTLMAAGVFEFSSDFSSHEVSGGLTSGGKNYPTYWTVGAMLAENSDDDSGTMLYGSMLKTTPMGGNWIFGYGAKVIFIDGEAGNQDFSSIVVPLRARVMYRIPISHPARFTAEYASAPRILAAGDVDVYDELRLEVSARIARNLHAALGLRQIYLISTSEGIAGNDDLFEFADGGFIGVKYYF